MAFRGLERVPVESAKAGDIISIAGLTTATVANTIADLDRSTPIKAQPIDPPTLSMRFAVNDSPDGGPRRRQGDEPHDPRPPDARSRGNVAIRVTEAPTRTASRSPGAANCSWAC
jgi:GTP-binding protein